MHRLKKLLDEAIEVLEDDLECEIKKAKACKCINDLDPHNICEIREDVDAIEDAICAKKYMGWLDDKPAHPMAGM